MCRSEEKKVVSCSGLICEEDTSVSFAFLFSFSFLFLSSSHLWCMIEEMITCLLLKSMFFSLSVPFLSKLPVVSSCAITALHLWSSRGGPLRLAVARDKMFPSV